MFKSFYKYHHLLNLYILVTILFSHDWDTDNLTNNLTNKIFTEKDIMQK